MPVTVTWPRWIWFALGSAALAAAYAARRVFFAPRPEFTPRVHTGQQTIQDRTGCSVTWSVRFRPNTAGFESRLAAPPTGLVTARRRKS